MLKKFCDVSRSIAMNSSSFRPKKQIVFKKCNKLLSQLVVLCFPIVSYPYRCYNYPRFLGQYFKNSYIKQVKVGNANFSNVFHVSLISLSRLF